MAPHHPKAAEQPTHEMVPIRTVQIRLNFDAAPPRRWKTRHLSQPRPTTHRPPHPNGPKHHQIASHMASTIWHTVEFSRNRRASPRDLSISSERLCRSESYLAFGPLPATCSGSICGPEPVPIRFRAHEAPENTSGGGHPRDQPPWFDPRCPFLPLGRHREHYARVAAGGKSLLGDPRHQTRSRA